MTEHFCHDCDKIRLTADGKLRPCLLSDKEIAIADAARVRNENLLEELLVKALKIKDAEHSVGKNYRQHFARTMSKIGG
jgi:cyclic pyranopterin phosphate synthase